MSRVEAAVGERAEVLSRAEAYLGTAGLLRSPGAALYSAEATLSPSPVYLLGLNPGGSEGATLADSIAASRAGDNAYVDQEWSPGGHLRRKGEAPLQRRVQRLCTAMGFHTRDVPASNLVFTRSTRLATHLDFGRALQLCLPVHALFVEAIQPRFLMTFGSIGNFKQAGRVLSMESRPADHGKWKAHRGTIEFCGSVLEFGNVPHLSLWASDHRPSVVEWVLERLLSD